MSSLIISMCPIGYNAGDQSKKGGRSLTYAKAIFLKIACHFRPVESFLSYNKALRDNSIKDTPGKKNSGI